MYDDSEAHVQGEPKLDIHLFSDPNHCVVSNMILNSLLITVMAVGTVPRARAALEPHEHGFYCELLEYSRWHKTSDFDLIGFAYLLIPGKPPPGYDKMCSKS